MAVENPPGSSPPARGDFDGARRAVVVEAGATVGETFRALFDRWGTVIPLGEYPGIGMGGHVVGGAFGLLCRAHGLAADHLYAAEVVTVDQHWAGKRERRGFEDDHQGQRARTF
jgi:FAD/FMN-containing dehydrogenase